MNPYSINPPESEVVFEELCLELLKLHCSRKGLERFAKKGEDQYGVDIFDTLGESPEYAAQCKLKEQWKSLNPEKYAPRSRRPRRSLRIWITTRSSPPARFLAKRSWP